MALIATAKQSQEFTLTPAGSHLARIDQIIDLGTHISPFTDKDGKNKLIHKIMIRFELPNELLEDGRPAVISLERSLTMGTMDGKKKSDLRKDIESLLGRELSVEEVKSFDVSSLLGTPATITVVHVPGKKDPTKKYAQITSMSGVPKGLPIPQPINKPTLFSLSSFDKEIYDLLPEWVQKKIALPPGIDLASSSNDENNDVDKLLA